MFVTTFLGHQGWLFQSENSCLLIDPLLHEEFGHIQALDYRVYPPRVLKPDGFPRIDAVLLSHEHDDHFDIPSLALLDRRVPIYLSARSSTAAWKILQQMGFTPRPLKPGVAQEFGNLEVLPLCGDHINTNCSDEWDALPYLVRHKGGAGSFFSMVDCTLTPGHAVLARAFVPSPGIVGWSNNTLDWSHMGLPIADAPSITREDETAKFTQQMMAAHYMLSDMWGTPAAMLLCAGGFSFYGERAWLNGRVFCVDPERVCKSMRAAFPNQRFYPTRPGQTFFMENNAIKKSDREQPFLTTAAQALWPLREAKRNRQHPDYTPATGRKVLDEEESAQLSHRLTEFAQALVDSPLFKSLHSLLETELKGRAPTFVFVLRSGDERQTFTYAYRPNDCDFEAVQEANPQAAYLAGMECWATDLLAVLRGDLGPITLIFGRAAFWNALPNRFQFAVFDALFRVSHPLRRPVEYLRTYQRLYEACSGVEPKIFGRW